MDMTPFRIRPNAPEVIDMADRWAELKSARSQHEAMWRDIARLLRPQRGGFQSTTPEARTWDKPLSSAPIMAAGNFSAGLYGTLTNPANQWFGFSTPDEDLNAWQPARDWLDKVTNITTRSLLPSVSTFYSAAAQFFADEAAFGNAAQYDEADAAEGRIIDATISLAEIVVDFDAHGRICEVLRQWSMTARRATSLFGMDLPAKILTMARERDMSLITFWHHVQKNDGFQAGRIGPKGKRWLSRYGCEQENTLVRERGYDEMPFQFARWEVDSGQTYGVGPGFVSLASARTYEQFEAAAIRMGQRVSDPTLLAPTKEDWPLQGRARPGSVIYGGVSFQGNQMIRPLEMGGNFNITLEEKQAKLEEIKDAFHYTLMQLSGRTGMTATEVLQINEERQRLWAPHQGRIQEEYLAPKLARRFSLLWRAGQLPAPPKGMPGVPLQVTYKSAAAAAMASSKGNAAMRVVQNLLPLAQINPRYADRIDADGLVETLAEAFGAPAAMFTSREAADQLAQQRAQAQQMAQSLQAAQMGASALKDATAAGAQAQAAQAQGQGAGQ